MFERNLPASPATSQRSSIYRVEGATARAAGSLALPTVSATSAQPTPRVRRFRGETTANLGDHSEPEGMTSASAEMSRRLASAQLVLGIAGAVAAVLSWYLLDSTSRAAIVFGGLALVLAISACAALIAESIATPRADRLARLALVVGALLVGAAALGGIVGLPMSSLLMGLAALLAAVYALVPLLAMLLFSTRAGVLAMVAGGALLPVVTYAGRTIPPLLATLSPGAPISALTSAPVPTMLTSTLAAMPWGLVLAMVIAFLVLGIGEFWCAHTLSRAQERTLKEYAAALARSREQVLVLRRERENLTQTITTQMESQAHARQEFAMALQKVMALGHVAERLALGDLSATRHLDPTLEEPLASLAGALGLLAQRVALTTDAQARARHALAEKVAATLREQRETIDAVHHAVRSGSDTVDAIVASLVAASSGYRWATSSPNGRASYPTYDDGAHLAARLTEQTTQYIAWIAHLHARQTEMENTVRQLMRLLSTPDEPSADEAETLALATSDLRRVLAHRWATSGETPLRPAER